MEMNQLGGSRGSRCCPRGGCHAGSLLHARETPVSATHLGHKSTAHEALKLLIGPETEHFLTTTDSILEFQIIINETEEFVEFVGFSCRKHIHKFISNMIRDTTRETSLTSSSHRRRV
jgi:hypothetical protein